MHGRVQGRDFHLRLTLAESTLRIEVTDTRTERQPLWTPLAPDSTYESGRGLHIVAALSDAWGVAPRVAAPGKTVWAEVRVPIQAPAAPSPADSVSREHDTESPTATSSQRHADLGSRPEAANRGDRRP
ncbi:ATP-binding protein [Streptomyces sp. NPDC003860]